MPTPAVDLPEDPAPPALVEIGLVVAGRLEKADREALQHARRSVLATLRTTFPEFTWRMPVVHRREFGKESPIEPVRLLDQAAMERETYRWDFTLIVTGADLVSYFKPFALGTPSKAVNAAALSTIRIDPAATGSPDHDQRVAVLAKRLAALMLHLLGHLNDLAHCDDPCDYMYAPRLAEDLDVMSGFSPEDRDWLRTQLAEEADVRLEETGRYRSALRFYTRILRRGFGDILRTVYRVQPWLFPLRLSRLTTAAVSTLLVLILTAEAWDLGMSQPPLLVLVFSVVVVLGTSAFIIKRQRLLLRRLPDRLSELRVSSNISMTVAVVLGMLTTYLLLFGATFLLTRTFYSPGLVAGWAASLEARVAFRHYLTLSGFVASLGLAIGALGASFEAQGYFRHVAYVDEET